MAFYCLFSLAHGAMAHPLSLLITEQSTEEMCLPEPAEAYTVSQRNRNCSSHFSGLTEPTSDDTLTKDSLRLTPKGVNNVNDYISFFILSIETSCKHTYSTTPNCGE